MHENEPAMDAALVRRLLEAQFPQWAELPIVPFASPGTTNWIYRLGDDLAIRLPRVGYGEAQVRKEREWLARLSPLLPLEVPVPLAQGEPGEGYPFTWSVSPWLAGDVLEPERLDDLSQAAVDLAAFILRLHAIDCTGGPLAVDHDLRGMPLDLLDVHFRDRIGSLPGDIDTDAVTAAWDVALAVPAWDGPPVWFHGDLLPGNILARDGRVAAVIDYGSLGVGDPACDLMIAWALFFGDSRNAFHSALGLDDATWARARGHAVYHAVIYIPYYLHSNPVGIAAARALLDAALADR